MGTVSEDLLAAAQRDAAAVLSDGLTVELVHDPEVAHAAAQVLFDIWRTPDGFPMNPETLLALAHTGNYVSIARLDGEIVGASAAFRTGDAPPELHSHITGVRSGLRGRNIGQAMKLHQRAWCLGEGIETVTWTFDPLQWRNAAFNLRRLGARITEYLPNFYGDMNDDLNRGLPSDRAYASWDLTRPIPTEPLAAPADAVALVADSGGRPVTSDALGADVHTVAVPQDISTLRRDDLVLATQWLEAVRGAFLPAFDQGYAVTGFDSHAHYVLTRPGDDSSIRQCLHPDSP